MIELKVEKIGDSLGVILPDDVIRRLNAVEGMSLRLSETPDGTYSLRSAADLKAAKAEDIIGRYSNTLRALAE